MKVQLFGPDESLHGIAPTFGFTTVIFHDIKINALRWSLHKVLIGRLGKRLRESFLEIVDRAMGFPQIQLIALYLPFESLHLIHMALALPLETSTESPGHMTRPTRKAVSAR